MKTKQKFELIMIIVLCAALVVCCVPLGAKVISSAAEPEKKYIKWMDFNVPYEAMNKAMNIDLKTHDTPAHIGWVDTLAYLGAKYGGNWTRYKAADMDKFAGRVKDGETIADITKDMKYYSFYSEAYGAVLSNFIGDYQVETPIDKNGTVITKVNYGLKAFSPIAKGYGYSHYSDFGDSRSFGYRRRHLGNDLLGSVGTPIIAVEGGVVECLGWNRYGGWRIGIRSFDKKRYYYYAHLRKGHPYADGLKQGQAVKSGDVIGYLGMTGYSEKENANNMTKPHLHFGMQIIFDESQKDGVNQIWIDVYDIVNLLQQNRCQVKKDANDYKRVYNYLDLQNSQYYTNKNK